MTACRAGSAGFVAAVLLTAVAAGRAGAASGPVTVRVASPLCAEAPAFTAFVASLRVELAGHEPSCCTVDTPGAPPPSAPAVTLALEPCDASGAEAVIAVGDGAGARSATRRISLADVKPGARPRALALAAAELVRAVGMTPAAPPASPPSGTRAVAGAEADLRLYPSVRTQLWGGRAAFSSVGRRWIVSADLAGATGTQRFDTGDVTVRLAGLGLGAGPRLPLRHAVLDLGLDVELGWAWIDGRSSAPGVRAGAGSGPIMAAAAQVAVEMPLSWPFRLRVVGQAGEVLRGLRSTVDSAPGAGITGSFVLFGIGVSTP
jgi:hypothetical protein